jgi:hypothetical protein
MQTTVNLPDSLYQKSEAVAAARGTTLEDLILQAIVNEVESNSPQVSPGISGFRVDLPIIPSKHPGTLDLSGFDFDDLLS